MFHLRLAMRAVGLYAGRTFVFIGLLACAVPAVAQTLPVFDFAQSSDTQGWAAAHDICKLAPTTNGLVATICGSDPYLNGPARDYPSGQLLWLKLRLKSDQSGTAQIFYFPAQGSPTEANSVRFSVPGGDWVDLRVSMPALSTQTRLRFDPPGSGGTCVLARISFDLRPVFQQPVWPRPVPPILASNAPSVTSGELSLAHDSASLGAFEVRVNGQSVAIGNPRSFVGYLSGPTPRWFAVTNSATVELVNSALRVRVAAADPDGAQWQFEQTFRPGATPGGIDVESRVTINQDRSVIFLPLLTLLPGVNTFGTNKTQAVFAGVEYLENEPSSSQADVTGPASRRQVPDSLKLTLPLMALSARSNYVGLMWEQSTNFAALHDSPDRLFQSGGHLMGIISPGADPTLRDDGSVLPYDGQLLKAGQTLTLRATILGARGNTIVPAVQQYVARRGLPVLPNIGYRASDYFTLEAHGWLDSQIRNGALFRHAVGASFNFTPAADAALYMDWLAAKVPDATLSARLTSAAADARAAVAPVNYNSAAVGHVRFPVTALVYGSVPDNVTTALNEGRAQLNLFQPDGSIFYQPPSGGVDLGSTHWARDANGLTASHVMTVLERGAFSGDSALISEGLRLLRALNKFRDTVPRGAQTWEVPLHTPDILASAWLVRAYTLGYELSGESDLLEQARYWAWTGLPFVYLTPPTDKPVGIYSTIPVFGATEFTFPWFGLPVQWCGLVYADAIRRFARHDPTGPWVQLADGIAAAGVQHTHLASEPAYQGLLPDSFNLRAQARNPVPINPATLLPTAIQLFGEAAVYDFHVFRQHGLRVHAPGPLTDLQETGQSVRFRANGWPKSPWYVLINGFTVGTVKLNGIETPLQPPGRLILRLNAPTTLEILVPANNALNIQRETTNAIVKLSWPAATTNYHLQSTTALAGDWTDVSTPVEVESAENVVHETVRGVSRFYRLIW